MVPVLEPGKVAGWVAPPTRGFGGKGLDFEYVLFH
jgi:benzoyl-CoA 2,3-dioxygenase component B